MHVSYSGDKMLCTWAGVAAAVPNYGESITHSLCSGLVVHGIKVAEWFEIYMLVMHRDHNLQYGRL